MGGGTTTSRLLDARVTTSLYPDDATATRSMTATALEGAPPPGERPWGAPGAGAEGHERWTKVIDALLEKIGALLDVAQAAHRRAELAPADLADMQRLELWYARLQAERERIQPPPAP